MNANMEKIEIYGHGLELPKNKLDTNEVRRVFVQVASDWTNRINKEFYEIFSNLEDLYNRGDDIANDIRVQSINEAMTFLVAHGIYEKSEEQFYEEFMEPYDSWDEDFGVVAQQFEAIVGKSAEVDAYRTARRQNRSQWVGYGSKQATYRADADNLISNIGHGVFNLMAKGVSAIGDSIKKDEIFRSEGTVQQVAEAAGSIATAAFLGAVDAINAETPEALHDYSAEEMKRTRAIIENIEKGRIPEDAILSALIKAISIYPYNHDIYSHLLRNYGGDQGGLDSVVEFFGIQSLQAEKDALIEAKFEQCDLSSLDKIKACFPDLENYAKHLCYDGFAAEYQRRIQEIEAKECANKSEVDSGAVSDGVTTDRDSELSLEVAVQGLKTNKDNKLYVAPELPEKKIRNFLVKNNLKVNEEEIVFFFDDTVFGSGDAGVIVDLTSIYVCLTFGEEHCVHLSDIQSMEINGVLNKKITIKCHDGKKVGITLTQSNSGAKVLCDAIRGLANLKSSLKST